eukprot:3931861-Rhodomonas_salina.1
MEGTVEEFGGENVDPRVEVLRLRKENASLIAGLRALNRNLEHIQTKSPAVRFVRSRDLTSEPQSAVDRALQHGPASQDDSRAREVPTNSLYEHGEDSQTSAVLAKILELNTFILLQRYCTDRISRRRKVSNFGATRTKQLLIRLLHSWRMYAEYRDQLSTASAKVWVRHQAFTQSIHFHEWETLAQYLLVLSSVSSQIFVSKGRSSKLRSLLLLNQYRERRQILRARAVRAETRRNQMRLLCVGHVWDQWTMYVQGQKERKRLCLLPLHGSVKVVICKLVLDLAGEDQVIHEKAFARDLHQDLLRTLADIVECNPSNLPYDVRIMQTDGGLATCVLLEYSSSSSDAMSLESVVSVIENQLSDPDSVLRNGKWTSNAIGHTKLRSEVRLIHRHDLWVLVVTFFAWARQTESMHHRNEFLQGYACRSITTKSRRRLCDVAIRSWSGLLAAKRSMKESLDEFADTRRVRCLRAAFCSFRFVTDAVVQCRAFDQIRHCVGLMRERMTKKLTFWQFYNETRRLKSLDMAASADRDVES